jgi:hypothetical protein
MTPRVLEDLSEAECFEFLARPVAFEVDHAETASGVG